MSIGKSGYRSIQNHKGEENSMAHLRPLRRQRSGPELLPYRSTSKFRKELFASRSLHAMRKWVFEMSADLSTAIPRSQTVPDDAVFDLAIPPNVYGC